MARTASLFGAAVALAIIVAIAMHAEVAFYFVLIVFGGLVAYPIGHKARRGANRQ
jgi:hypothetical protein